MVRGGGSQGSLWVPQVSLLWSDLPSLGFVIAPLGFTILLAKCVLNGHCPHNIAALSLYLGVAPDGEGWGRAPQFVLSTSTT